MEGREGLCGCLTFDGVFRGTQKPGQEQEVEKVDQGQAIEPEEAGWGVKREGDAVSTDQKDRPGFLGDLGFLP